MHIPSSLSSPTSLALVESRLNIYTRLRVGTHLSSSSHVCVPAPLRETLPLNAAEHRNPLPKDFWRPAIRLNTVRQEDSGGDEGFFPSLLLLLSRFFFPFSSFGSSRSLRPRLLLPFCGSFPFSFFISLFHFCSRDEKSLWKIVCPGNEGVASRSSQSMIHI